MIPKIRQIRAHNHNHISNVAHLFKRHILCYAFQFSLAITKMSSLAEKDVEAGSSTSDSQHNGKAVTAKIEPKVELENEAEAEDESEYISGVRLYLIILGLCMAVLLIGLVCCLQAHCSTKADFIQDNSILATVISAICLLAQFLNF